MWKKVLAASAAIAVAGLTLAYAQPYGGPNRDRDGDRGAPQFQRWQPSADDIKAFVNARVAGMKAGLALNAEQEKNWGPFEDAYRGVAKMRTDRMLAFREGRIQPPANIVEFMQRRADRWSEGAAAFKKLADAATPLYQSLDESQKQRFGALMRMMRPRQARFGMPGEGMDGGRRGGWMHRDGGQFERGMGPGNGRGMGPGGPGMDRFRERGFERPRFGELPQGGDPFADLALYDDDDIGNEFAEIGRPATQGGAR